MKLRLCVEVAWIAFAVPLLAEIRAAPFEPPMPTRVVIPNSGFEGPLAGTWVIRSAKENSVQRGPDRAYAGDTSIVLRDTEGATVATLDRPHLVPVLPGETYKFAAWVCTDDATGETYLSIEGTGDGKEFRQLDRSSPAKGSSPDWVQWSVLAEIPNDGSITSIRPALHSDGNTGSALFDSVALWKLPEDAPVDTGPPWDPAWGQITARDGHLVGESGERLRLWGINCVDEPGRTYREMTYITHRIRQMGFNAVRLHLYDVRFIDATGTTENGESTTLRFQQPQRGDGSLLDKLDYFIYCVEREGLYLYLTFDRLRCRFRPGDYHVLPSDGSEDEAAWKSAVDELQPQRADEHVYYVDPRLGEAQAQFVEQLLNHRNTYTGRRIADDPYVALYELTNENHFPEQMLTGRFREWPAYFRAGLQARWNVWLTDRYRDDAALLQTWGRVRDHERLGDNSVQVAPVLGEAHDYPAERLADFHRFINHLFIHYSRRLEQIIRDSGRCAARTPVSWDTLHEHKHKWYFPCSQAGLMSVGTYVQGPARPDSEKRRIKPGFQGFYNLSFASVLDKPTVVYESNTLKPDYWRADYPLILATFASTHDWDGVFWYTWGDGTVRNQFDVDAYVNGGLRYASRGHQWHGIVCGTDEVLLASLRMAGTIFRTFAVPATDPVVVTVGARDLLGSQMWIGNIDVPFPSDAPGPYHRSAAMSATDLQHTVRYQFDLSRKDSHLSRPLIARIPDPCSPVEGVTYDCGEGILLVDTPSAKSAAGFWVPSVSFDDDIHVELTDSVSPPFACFGFIAQDGLPLSESQSALLALTTSGENRGRVLWDDPTKVAGNTPLFTKQVKSWGAGPPDVLRPGMRVRLGGEWHWKLIDFRLDTLAQGTGDELEIRPGTPLFYVELSRDR